MTRPFGEWCYCNRETPGQSILRVGLSWVPRLVEMTKLIFASTANTV
jgi:hypothetical protein